ncbi:MAG: DMT family transporter [Pseudomonadota bacterium]|nr:DMT family transporter [Pseudomonadota bacterium]MEC8269010.1 DMT family transporter [Pseudomonadota bacterium]
MSGTGTTDADGGQVNLPLGVSVALGEIAIMVAVSVLVKLVSADIDTVTVLLFRYLLCLPLLVATAVWQRGGKALSITAPRTLAIRIVTGLISLACFYAALDLMALSLVTVLFQTLTLFVTFLAPLLLGERVGWRRWTAVVIGFGGTVLLLNPSAAGWTMAGVLLGLGSPFFGAMMMIALRKLGRRDSPATTAVWHNGCGALVFAAIVMVTGANMPSTGTDIGILVAVGVLSSFQQFGLAFSHKLLPASIMAPLHYLSIPMGITAGILLFGEVLTPEIVIGSAIIIASSIFILRRERQLQASSGR